MQLIHNILQRRRVLGHDEISQADKDLSIFLIIFVIIAFCGIFCLLVCYVIEVDPSFMIDNCNICFPSWFELCILWDCDWPWNDIYCILDPFRHFLGWTIHVICCSIATIILGFNTSLGVFLHLLFEYNLKQTIGYYTQHREASRFLFDNKIKKVVFDKQYGEYMQILTPYQDLILRVCCLQYFKSCQTGGNKKLHEYLDEKRRYLFSGVTMKKLQKKVTTTEDDENHCVSIQWRGMFLVTIYFIYWEYTAKSEFCVCVCV